MHTVLKSRHREELRLDRRCAHGDVFNHSDKISHDEFLVAFVLRQVAYVRIQLRSRGKMGKAGVEVVGCSAFDRPRGTRCGGSTWHSSHRRHTKASRRSHSGRRGRSSSELPHHCVVVSDDVTTRRAAKVKYQYS